MPDVPEFLEICMGIALGVFPAKGGVSPSATVTAIVFQLGFDRQSEQPSQQLLSVIQSLAINGVVTEYHKPVFLKPGEQLIQKVFSILFEFFHAESFDCVAHKYCTVVKKPLTGRLGVTSITKAVLRWNVTCLFKRVLL